ncbi:AMP-binding protein [Nonomuraea sp. NEAU-A123]|uniref:AMP-binding protein n=1 Tax=Nonomuraea sp. NEAU-A123 TaxID=2839649 RepID=UPI001BE3D8A8|nr:AMP-binding protein [Nonomuraea sp. NEAU-A123]MBT2224925.1 AMP-binding protein [Nonomuraea sp. NEAU-A123]
MDSRGADDVTALPETMLDVLERRATVAPEAELVRFEDGVSLRVGECHERAIAVARGLAGLVSPGDRVLTCLRPGPRLIEVLFALARLGAVEVPLALDTRLTAAEQLTAATGARVLITGTDAIHDNPDLLTLATRMDHVVLATEREKTEVPGSVDLDDLVASPGRLPSWRPGPADPAVVMATSGTTGRAKAALLPHFAGVRHARRVVRTMDYGPHDVLYNVFPWNHINVRHAGLLPALITGATLVAHPRFSASRFWDTCRRERITAFNFMGAIAAILERTSATDTDHQVRRAYGGPAPEALSRRFLDRFGVLLLEAYACTELGDVAASTPTTRRPGSAGRPVPEYEVVITDDHGHPLPAGQIGQITARPRAQSITFTSYAGDDAATGKVLRDGWFTTGDRGRLDDDGYLYFAGRRTDVIRRRGENIPTWDVEQAVAAMPGVLDAAAVGVPSELTEEEVLVAVSAAPGTTLTAPQVHAWCLDRLPRHAVPRYIRILNDLPRNTSTKVVKGELRGQGVPPDAWDATASIS